MSKASFLSTSCWCAHDLPPHKISHIYLLWSVIKTAQYRFCSTVPPLLQCNLNSFVVSELSDIIFCMAQHSLVVYKMLSVAQVTFCGMIGWLVNGESGNDVAGSSCGLICLMYYYYCSILMEQMSKTTTNFKLREAPRLKVFWEQCAEENIRTHETVSKRKVEKTAWGTSRPSSLTYISMRKSRMRQVDHVASLGEAKMHAASG